MTPERRVVLHQGSLLARRYGVSRRDIIRLLEIACGGSLALGLYTLRHAVGSQEC
jgi:hypothetical protein